MKPEDIFRTLKRKKAASEVKVTWPIVFLILILGVVFLASASYLTNERLDLIRNGLHAEGIVTSVEKVTARCSHEQRNRMHNCYKYVSVISYKDDQMKDQSFKTDFRSNKPVYTMDEKVDVLYKPGHPETARANTFISMWMVPGILVFFGFFLVYGGIRHSIRLLRASEATL